MAGDWIPISVDLPGKPEVARLAALTRRSPDEIVGVLIRFWIWAQSHTADGFLHGMDLAMTAAVSHVPAWFLEGLCQVGWLTISETGLCIPNFDRWFGGAAKRRLQDRLRKRYIRARPQNVRKMSASKADKMRTREEENGAKKEKKRGKRKEKISLPCLPSISLEESEVYQETTHGKGGYRGENQCSEENNARRPPSRFIKPSVEEVAAYCKQRGNTVDPEAFWAFYQSKGWMVGKNPMKDWKAAVRTWERNRLGGTQRRVDNAVIGRYITRVYDGAERSIRYFTGDDTPPEGHDAEGEVGHLPLLGESSSEAPAGSARLADG